MQLNPNIVEAFVVVIAGIGIVALTYAGEILIPLALLAIIGYFVYERLHGKGIVQDPPSFLHRRCHLATRQGGIGQSPDE